MKTFMIAAGATIWLSATPNVSQAQTPSTQPQTPSPAAQPAQRALPNPVASVTMSGCVYREQAVPGRTPNVAEKAGVLEDYILADARMVNPPAGAAQATEAGTNGRMYKLEGLPDERLRALAGKRVEVSGRIDTNDEEGATGVARPDRNPISPDAIDLSDFVATSIRELTGANTCPATPAAPPVVPR